MQALLKVIIRKIFKINFVNMPVSNVNSNILYHVPCLELLHVM
jgi:hypothetical protein